MGNRIGGRRPAVDERYTRPQGLYEHRDIDYKKLRRLILDSKLAPCYSGGDDRAADLEECPICFLFYPSLNQSRCCLKSICTECFLQIKPHHTTCPAQCPFCKTSNYAVEYRGARTKEERGIEQIEEQRVIEAQIRLRRQEQLDEEERKLRGEDESSTSRIVATGELEHRRLSSDELSESSFRVPEQGDESMTAQALSSMPIGYLLSRERRDDNFDLDLEDIMVMEAVWLSIQDIGNQRPPSCDGGGGDSSSIGSPPSQPVSHTEPSPSSGLAHAVAAMAERQLASRSSSGSSTNIAAAQSAEAPPYLRMIIHSEEASRFQANNPLELPSRPSAARSGSGATLEAIAARSSRVAGGFDTAASGHVIPESFEEQVMLATAVSLAEAQARDADTPWPAAWI